MKKIIYPGKRFGTIKIPPSKSDSQRAILASALSKGQSTLFNVGKSNDEISMISAIKKLGAEVIEKNKNSLLIKGIEKFPREAQVNLGESGLGIRLITSICAANEGTYMISGIGSLENRPMSFFEKTLPKFKASILSNNGLIPLEIKGPMIGSNVEIDGSESSQYISGMLMSLPLLKEDSRIQIKNITSLPYIQMTLNTIQKFGIEILHSNFEEYIIRGNQNYLPTNYPVESDWSSASYWLVASALGMNIKLRGLSMSSLQADRKITEAFESANCKIEFDGDSLRINGRNRQPFSFDATHCPDLFPALVTFASLCDGISSIKGVNRLQFKESNRGLVLQQEFQNIGVNLIIDEDTLYIHGKKSIEGGKINAQNDHRIAMCFAIAALFSDEEIEIKSSESVNKSYPDFWEDLERLHIDSRK